MVIVSAMVKESLEKQPVCPKCKANWRKLEKSLASESNVLALWMLENCKVCMMRFSDEYNRLKGE